MHYAFTRSDYISSFSRKGNVCLLALLEKNQNAIEMFSKLGEGINVEQCTDAEKLVFYVWTKETILRCLEMFHFLCFDSFFVFFMFTIFGIPDIERRKRGIFS